MPLFPHIARIFNNPLIGKSATITRAPSATVLRDVRVIVDRAAEVWQGDVVLVVDTVSLLRADGDMCEPGDVVELSTGEKWKLVNRVFEDENESRFSVRKG